jgi:hypothetical protein
MLCSIGLCLTQTPSNIFSYNLCWKYNIVILLILYHNFFIMHQCHRRHDCHELSAKNHYNACSCMGHPENLLCVTFWVRPIFERKFLRSKDIAVCDSTFFDTFLVPETLLFLSDQPCWQACFACGMLMAVTCPCRGCFVEWFFSMIGSGCSLWFKRLRTLRIVRRCVTCTVLGGTKEKKRSLTLVVM